MIWYNLDLTNCCRRGGLGKMSLIYCLSISSFHGRGEAMPEIHEEKRIVRG